MYQLLVVFPLGSFRAGGAETNRTSQRRPSVAVCFFVFSSFRQRSWTFSDSAGAASCLSRSFYGDTVSYLFPRGFWSVLPLPRMAKAHLDIAEHVILDGGEGNRAEDIWFYVSNLACRLAGIHRRGVAVPKMVVSDSAASRNSEVEMALPLAASTGTSLKDRLSTWTIVPPGGNVGAEAMMGN